MFYRIAGLELDNEKLQGSLTISINSAIRRGIKIAELEARNKELIEALESIIKLKDRPDNVDFWDYKVKWVKGCYLAEQALKNNAS